MAIEPWYKVVQPRREVRQGRSFNPDEFAIALEQVVAGTAPEDYRDAEAFFARTCFTRALREHTAMVLRRLSGETVNAAPVTTLVTQFGGGKTHALASLYHLVRSPEKAESVAEVGSLLQEIGLTEIPHARAGVFVGNAWDPGEGRSAALDLERRGYFVRRVGGGFRVHHQPTIRKVVSDRRAALDEQNEIRPAVRNLVKEEFDRRAAIPRVFFPEDGAAVPDSQKLTLVVIDPEAAWTGEDTSDLRERIVRWTRERGSADSLCGRALAALRSRGLLNDSVGASYVERYWPPANSTTGAWPLSMLRKCFLDGSLTRLVDPDAVLRSSIVEWVADGEFGLGSGGDGEGLLYAPERVWFQEPVPPEEVMFDPDICLLKRKIAERLKAAEGEPQSDREMERHKGQGFEFAVGGPSGVRGEEAAGRVSGAERDGHATSSGRMARKASAVSRSTTSRS